MLQFLSYEGSLIAADGPAMGMTSTDIGVLEDSLSPVGNSLQLEGLGLTYDDFSWAGATNAASWGALNAGQRAHCPFINELHYDNSGTDVNERVEIAGRAGTDLTGFSLVFYNGATLSQYAVLALSGVLPDQQAGMGTLSFAQAVIQNGAADGLALVNDAGAVIEFLSYEGSFTATDGPAAGLTSTDIGVLEDGLSSGESDSLQLSGMGVVAADFTWTGPAGESFGQPNVAQTFLVTDALALFVHEVQGNGTVSPHAGSAVVVDAVVVAVLQSPGGQVGYFLQEEDADADADPATSEGIFVFDSATSVAAGHMLRVLGEAAELNSQTQLGNVQLAQTLATGVPTTPTSTTSA